MKEFLPGSREYQEHAYFIKHEFKPGPLTDRCAEFNCGLPKSVSCHDMKIDTQQKYYWKPGTASNSNNYIEVTTGRVVAQVGQMSMNDMLWEAEIIINPAKNLGLYINANYAQAAVEKEFS